MTCHSEAAAGGNQCGIVFVDSCIGGCYTVVNATGNSTVIDKPVAASARESLLR